MPTSSVCLVILLAVFSVGSLSARERNSDRNTIVVKLVDGVTGLPIWAENPNIWVGESSGINPRTNWKGEIMVDIRKANRGTIRFLPNWYADCRYKRDVQTGAKVEYGIEEILETGVVGANVCGRIHASPRPGVLILYVRWRTFIEQWTL